MLSLYFFLIAFTFSIFGLISGYKSFELGGLLFTGIISVILTSISLFEFTEKIFIPTENSGSIEIISNKQDSLTTQDFIDELKNIQKKYLLKKYASVDKALPAEQQIHYLNWLRDNNHLTIEEYESKMNELLKKNNGSMGFISD
ncbi:MAG: hypothetical protein HC867_06610 [Bacteroidia bacterium]|nr:hypothetical protein [Bacteroidia bacterium]